MLSIRDVFFVLAFFVAVPLLGQQNNRPISPELPGYEFVSHQTTSPVFYALGIFKIYAISPIGPLLAKHILMDENGYVVWYTQDLNSRNVADFRYNPERKIYSYQQYVTNIGLFAITLDSNFKLINTLQPVDGALFDAHEFFVNRAGNRVLSAHRDSIFDLSAYTFDGIPGGASTIVDCFCIQEIDANDNLIWEWNSCDVIHPTEGYPSYGYSPARYDYAHGNAIEEDTDGNYLVSFRHLNAIVKVERSSGNILWQLGGKSSDFTLVNDSGFSGQHDVRRLQNGNISLFDNGNMASVPRSRGLEITLDMGNWTATKIREVEPNPATFSSGMGSFRQDSILQVMGYGLNLSHVPVFSVWDNADNLVSEVFFEDSIQSYRIQIARPGYFPARPEITCLDSAGNLYLTATDGHGRYLWSTGDSTRQIVANTNTTYMVWVPQGIGMLGSEPLEIGPVATCTPPVHAPEPAAQSSSPELLYISDLLGRRIAHPKPGQVYIYYYSDFSYRKRIYFR